MQVEFSKLIEMVENEEVKERLKVVQEATRELQFKVVELGDIVELLGKGNFERDNGYKYGRVIKIGDGHNAYHNITVQFDTIGGEVSTIDYFNSNDLRVVEKDTWIKGLEVGNEVVIRGTEEKGIITHIRFTPTTYPVEVYFEKTKTRPSYKGHFTREDLERVSEEDETNNG